MLNVLSTLSKINGQRIWQVKPTANLSTLAISSSLIRGDSCWILKRTTLQFRAFSQRSDSSDPPQTLNKKMRRLLRQGRLPTNVLDQRSDINILKNSAQIMMQTVCTDTSADLSVHSTATKTKVVSPSKMRTSMTPKEWDDWCAVLHHSLLALLTNNQAGCSGKASNEEVVRPALTVTQRLTSLSEAINNVRKIGAVWANLSETLQISIVRLTADLMVPARSKAGERQHVSRRETFSDAIRHRYAFVGVCRALHELHVPWHLLPSSLTAHFADHFNRYVTKVYAHSHSHLL